jgi:hypothetical protein
LGALRRLAGIVHMCVQGITLQGWNYKASEARLYRGFTEEDSLGGLNLFWKLAEKYLPRLDSWRNSQSGDS